MDWNEKGINTNWKKLNNLRFADDVILITENEGNPYSNVYRSRK